MRAATPLRMTLRVGLSTAFVGVVLVTAGVLCVVLVGQMREQMRRDLTARMRDVASVAAMGVAGDLHRQVRGRTDEASPTFLALKAALQDVKRRVPDLRFAYTIKRQPDGRLAFWVDAETDAEGTHVGDEVTVVTPALQAMFEPPFEARVEPDFYTDRWGTWLSAYAPVRATDGTLECIVGVDISAARIADAEWAAIRTILLTALVITLLVCGVGVWLSSRIARPLALLDASMQRVRGLHLDDAMVIESRFREIAQMADTLSAMQSGLRSFRKYVPKELVRELIEDGTEATLGTRGATLTVFFSDIAGFTSLAEATTPEGLAADLAEYFATITDTILASGGTVDKYIGDAVMAFWGAPKPLDAHAERGMRAALDVHARLDALNARRVAEGRAPITTRIGLATGEVVVGNFGYDERMNYTVMGDCVNLSSRLEGLNKQVGTRILVSEATQRAAGEAMVSRLLGAVAVKGKRAEVRVWTPVWPHADATAADLARVARWNAAVEQYMAGDFAGALPAFEAYLAEAPDDEPARQKVDACRRFIALPPEDTWDGALVAGVKS